MSKGNQSFCADKSAIFLLHTDIGLSGYKKDHTCVECFASFDCGSFNYYMYFCSIHLNLNLNFV